MMQLPVLNDFEKAHLSERQALPERYLSLSDEEMDRRIAAAKAALGTRVVILGHHYQRDEVIKFADYTGDSFKLARQISKRPDADFTISLIRDGTMLLATLMQPAAPMLINGIVSESSPEYIGMSQSDRISLAMSSEPVASLIATMLSCL